VTNIAMQESSLSSRLFPNLEDNWKVHCLVLVIEWQPRWTNMCLSEIHRWLVHRNTCVSNTCHGGGNGLDMLQGSHMWWRSSFHETWHGVMWLRWRRSRQGLAWWTGCKSEGQVEDLAPMDRGNSEKQVRPRSMNQYGHVMIWSGSYHLLIKVGAYVASTSKEMKWNAQGKGIFVGHFISRVIGV
jgi:hypothetical protein